MPFARVNDIELHYEVADFTRPWELVGELVIENFSGSAELNKLQLTVGCL